MRARTLFFAATLAALLAGCTTLDPPATAAREAAPPPASPRAAEVLPAPRALPSLPIDLAVVERWFRPGEPLEATLVAPDATSHAWLLASRNPLRGEPHHGTPEVSAAIAPLPPGEDAPPLRLGHPGLHTFTLREEPRAAFAALVRPDLPPLHGFVVHLVPGGPFVPASVELGPGSTLVVRNRLDATATVAQRDFHTLIGTGPTLRYAFPADYEQGDYELAAHATRADGAVGLARAALVYDSRKPAERAVFGPFAATLRGAAPVGEPHEHALETRHPARALDLFVNASSDAPAEYTLDVTLVGPDGARLAPDSSEDGRLRFLDLPKGAYRVRLEAREGALVRYELVGVAHLRLDPPPSFFAS